jgi:hypothetical protein
MSPTAHSQGLLTLRSRLGPGEQLSNALIMPLTDCERAFLAALIDEAATDLFQGPATERLQRRELYATDRPHLLAASHREGPPGPQAFGGKYQPAPPPGPGLDREMPVQPDREVAAEEGQQPWPDAPAHRVVGPGRAS